MKFKCLLPVMIVVLMVGAQAPVPRAFGQSDGSFSVSVDPTSANCGDTVSVSGSGWTPGATVNINILELSSDVSPQATVQADDSGDFSDVSLDIPDGIQSGSYSVNAESDEDGAAVADLEVACTQTGPAILDVSPQQVSPGDMLSVAGMGFAPNSSVDLSLLDPGSNDLADQSVLSDADGNIDATFSVPFGADTGTYIVTADDGSSPQVSADVTVEVNASITSITPDPANPGATLDVEGTDFPAGAAVSAVVTCGAAGQDTPGTVDADGILSVQAPVPDDAPAGECQVDVQEDGSSLATGSFEVQDSPVFYLDPPGALPGDPVTVRGTGLSPGDTVQSQAIIDVASGGSQNVSGSGTADGSGDVAIDLSVPTGAQPGTYSVDVLDSNGTLIDTETLTVTVPPTIIVMPSVQRAAASSVISISGAGFTPFESVTAGYRANLTTGGQQDISVTGQADEDGNVFLQLPVPANVAPSSSYTVTAVGESSGRSDSDTFAVSSNPQLRITPSTVAAGAVIMLSGTGFPAQSTVTLAAQVPALMGGTQVVSATTVTGTSGAFTRQVAIPAGSRGGPVVFTASARDSGGQNASASATVVVTRVAPTLTAASSTVNSGAQVRVTGANFAAGPQDPVILTLKYMSASGQTNRPQTVDASSAGAFTAVVAIPSDAMSQTAMLTAAQSRSGITVTIKLSVKSTAAAAPVLGTPRPTATPTPSPTAPPVTLKIASLKVENKAVKVGGPQTVQLRLGQSVVASVTMTISFPNGSDLTFHGKTSGQGTWSRSFLVPGDATTVNGSTAQVKLTAKASGVTARANTQFTLTL